jgi:redox-sensitive bicupin YhaK (pirin superfamily)
MATEENTASAVLGTVKLGLHWPTIDPFLFVAHHLDRYPPGNADQGIDPAALAGRSLGSDFELRDGWRMYHGNPVPGFPRHPHRGFETITLASQGHVDHHDSLGATARFGSGDVQWMTAGRGIVHSEMFPLTHREQDNPTELLQIWLNLPAKNKMVEPYFTMLWAEQMPTYRWVAESGGVTEVVPVVGAIDGDSPPPPPPQSWAADPAHGMQIWRIRMGPDAAWSLPPGAAGHGRVLYFYAGEQMRVDGMQVPVGTGLQLSPTAQVRLENLGAAAELLLLSGQPIAEPVAQHGPFVMNTQEQLQQAFTDYQRTGFGGWPWDRDDPVHPADQARFAKHADGRIEEPSATSGLVDHEAG